MHSALKLATSKGLFKKLGPRSGMGSTIWGAAIDQILMPKLRAKATAGHKLEGSNNVTLATGFQKQVAKPVQTQELSGAAPALPQSQDALSRRNLSLLQRKSLDSTEYEDPKDDLVSFQRDFPDDSINYTLSMMKADMVTAARRRGSTDTTPLDAVNPRTGASIRSDSNKMHRQVLELTEHVESKGAFKKVPEADKEKTEGLGRAVGRLQIEGPSGKTAAQRIINRMGEPDATEGPYETPEWLTKLASTKDITPKGSYLQNPEATKILKTLTREQQQTLALSNIYAAKGSDKSMKEYHTGKDYRKGLKGLYAKGIKGTPSLKNTASVKRAMEKLHPKKKP